MMWTGLPTLVFLLLLLSPNACSAFEQVEKPTADVEPYQVIQRVLVLQDAIARLGSPALVPFQRELNDAGARLRQAPAAAWQKERNASAAVLFVLCGGNRSTAETILAQPLLNEPIRALLKASLDFVKGRTNLARAALAGLNLENVQPALRGNLALTRGMVFSREQPTRSRHEFSLARLYAPGGVVEQVSLRLEVELAKHDGQAQSAELLLRQLLLRFPHGLHLQEAIETVAELASRAEAGRQTEISASVESLLPHLPKELQLAVSLSFARQAVLHGQMALAAAWALRGKFLAEDGSAQRLQAALYAAAANVILNPGGDASGALAMIDPARLSKDDASLLQSAIVVEQHIREPVDAPSPLDPSARREPDDSSATAPLEADAARLVKKANASLDRVAQLLESKP